MIELTVYSRDGCHLCELMLEEIARLYGARVRVTVLDVDSRDDWRQLYGLKVPVLSHMDREICFGRLDTAAMRAVLTA
ncbi:MAG: glutaredoxin family protein [Gammaproteobacteria bacterium]|nr:glutaredoxin family protein [Gammaproteobacteria bacterium]